MVITTVCVQIENVSVIRDLLSINVRRKVDLVARFCQPSGNVFENSNDNDFSVIIDVNIGPQAISKHDMNWFDVRIAFPSGLVRLNLDFLLSFDYPLGVLIPFKIIAKASRMSGILNTI